MKEKLFFIVPYFIQIFLITIFNIQAYRKRYGGNYKKYLSKFKKNKNLTFSELEIIQKQRYTSFINDAVSNSNYYNKKLSNIEGFENIHNIQQLPIISKEELRKNIKSITTISENKGIVSKTGGTTGKSLKVIFTKENTQERFAMLDNFRSNFGYELGKKTAWFSGKNLISESDVGRNRFWKTDYLHKVRYYSTFHIKSDYLKYYIDNLIDFKPLYLVGFPSTMVEIAKYGIRHNIDFPSNIVKAIFPTAETVTQSIRNDIEFFFKTKIYDQYASSEGAPFIFECINNNLHLEIQSGVFEVLNHNNLPSRSGKLVVTSFTTSGTPLIRYDIGDSIIMSDKKCTCGNANPLVEKILGRIDDFIFSPENGKINLGNVSNTLKNTTGIVRFQVIQEALHQIIINMVVDKATFTKESQQVFHENWIQRVGGVMEIQFNQVTTIPFEKSGKFRLVKNKIRHLIDN